MSLKVHGSTGGDFEIIPAGQYTARCFKVIDLGTQETEYMGEKKLQAKVMIVWEILDDDVKMQDGRPFAVTKTYTASLNEKSHLYKDLSAWRGKPFTSDELLEFDISKLVGAYCTVQIVHNEVGDKTYANINAIMGTKERPDPVNPDVLFDIHTPNMAVFETFSDWLKQKIQASQEWRSREYYPDVAPANAAPANAPTDEPLPPEPVDLDDPVKDGEPIDLSDIPF